MKRMNQPADDNPRRGRIRRSRGGRTAAERIVADWRRLSGGTAVRDGMRRTLVACSGGADSTALALALGTAASDSIVLAYIAHDIRDNAIVEQEAQAVRNLAAKLNCHFVTRAVSVKGAKGNLEAQARQLRYDALRSLAAEHDCRFVATGHQATDQLETLLMRLARGSGPQGLRGILGTRRLRPPAGRDEQHLIMLIRPMLKVTRQESEKICVSHGWYWSLDATNHDLSLLRNAIRSRIIPILAELAPGIEGRSSRAAALQEEAQQMQQILVRAAIKRCRADESVNAGSEDVNNTVSWDRAKLREEGQEFGAGLVRTMVWSQLRQQNAGIDRVNHLATDAVVLAVLGPGRHAKHWRISGVEIRMTSRLLTFTALPRNT